jgi:hypothetical protein
MTSRKKLKGATDKFPTLMKHKSGSVVLMNFWNGQYFMTCLSPDIGKYHFGQMLKTDEKGLQKDFTEMPQGFYINIERKNSKNAT